MAIEIQQRASDASTDNTLSKSVMIADWVAQILSHIVIKSISKV